MKKYLIMILIYFSSLVTLCSKSVASERIITDIKTFKVSACETVTENDLDYDHYELNNQLLIYLKGNYNNAEGIIYDIIDAEYNSGYFYITIRFVIQIHEEDIPDSDNIEVDDNNYIETKSLRSTVDKTKVYPIYFWNTTIER